MKWAVTGCGKALSERMSRVSDRLSRSASDKLTPATSDCSSFALLVLATEPFVTALTAAPMLQRLTSTSRSRHVGVRRARAKARQPPSLIGLIDRFKSVSELEPLTLLSALLCRRAP